MRKCFSIKRKSYSIETKYQAVEMKVDEYDLKQLWNHWIFKIKHKSSIVSDDIKMLKATHFLNILENIRKDIELDIKKL